MLLTKKIKTIPIIKSGIDGSSKSINKFKDKFNIKNPIIATNITKPLNITTGTIESEFLPLICCLDHSFTLMIFFILLITFIDIPRYI